MSLPPLLVPRRKHPMSTLVPRRARRRPRPALWALLLPFVVMFTLFFIAPIIYALVQSMFATKSSGLGLGRPETVFVFFDNYARALSDATFVESLGRLLLFSAILVPLMVITALGLALLLDSGRAWGGKFFRVLYFAPYGVPGVVATLLWGFLYVPATSPILQMLEGIGVSINPLSGDNVLFAIANIALWGFAGYNMIILISALHAIPSELYEAARVDGASAWSIIWSIKLPLVRPSLILVTVFTVIGTLQLFAEAQVLKTVSPAIDSQYTPNLSAYTTAFAYNEYNVAAAQAVLIAVVAFALSFTFLKLTNRKSS